MWTKWTVLKRNGHESSFLKLAIDSGISNPVTGPSLGCTIRCTRRPCFLEVLSRGRETEILKPDITAKYKCTRTPLVEAKENLSRGFNFIFRTRLSSIIRQNPYHVGFLVIFKLLQCNCSLSFWILPLNQIRIKAGVKECLRNNLTKATTLKWI